jgi:hypothetical protein
VKTSEKLFLAAGVLATAGLIGHVRVDSSGKRCALGALDKVSEYEHHGLNEGWGYYDSEYEDATAAMALRLRTMQVPEAEKFVAAPSNKYSDGSLLATWSNNLADAGKDREVIELFREVARDLAKVGQ